MTVESELWLIKIQSPQRLTDSTFTVSKTQELILFLQEQLQVAWGVFFR